MIGRPQGVCPSNATGIARSHRSGARTSGESRGRVFFRRFLAEHRDTGRGQAHGPWTLTTRVRQIHPLHRIKESWTV